MFAKLFVILALAFAFGHSATLLPDPDPTIYQAIADSEFHQYFHDSDISDFGSYMIDTAKKFSNWLFKIKDTSSKENEAFVAAQNGETTIPTDLKQLLRLYYSQLEDSKSIQSQKVQEKDVSKEKVVNSSSEESQSALITSPVSTSQSNTISTEKNSASQNIEENTVSNQVISSASKSISELNQSTSITNITSSVISNISSEKNQEETVSKEEVTPISTNSLSEPSAVSSTLVSTSQKNQENTISNQQDSSSSSKSFSKPSQNENIHSTPNVNADSVVDFIHSSLKQVSSNTNKQKNQIVKPTSRSNKIPDINVRSNYQTSSKQNMPSTNSDSSNTNIFKDIESTVNMFNKEDSIKSVTDKPLTKEQDAAAKKAAFDAHYTFAYDVDNNIEGNSQQHVETRKDGKLYGKYSFDDGNNFVTRYYIADENGFRIVKETVIPSKKVGRALNGLATVHMKNEGTNSAYSVTKEDIQRCHIE